MESHTNHSLAPYTTVKIGGPADTFIETNTTEEFIEVLKETPNPTILGNGSNVLISDSGIRGTVVKNSANLIEYLPQNQVRVDSGTQLPLLINDAVDHSLSGLEEFSYIPSTIGGAIYGNIHGVDKNDFNKFLVSITIFDLNSSTISEPNPKSLSWSYDTSEFQSHPEWVILSAVLQLKPGDITASRQIVTDIIAKKSPIQSMNSLGCVFKNPPGDSAGRIIDQELNLKGYRLNDVQVSPTHANFIINCGHGTATDYYSLIKKIQTEAKAKGFTLETEIKFLGDFV